MDDTFLFIEATRSHTGPLLLQFKWGQNDIINFEENISGSTTLGLLKWKVLVCRESYVTARRRVWTLLFIVTLDAAIFHQCHVQVDFCTTKTGGTGSWPDRCPNVKWPSIKLKKRLHKLIGTQQSKQQNSKTAWAGSHFFHLDRWCR